MTTQDYALSIESYFVKNFWPGRDGYMPMAIVEHSMQGTLEETYRYFNREEGEYYVSAHYGIGQDGRIWQFVKDEDTAWANGLLREPDSSIDWIKEVAEEGVNPNLITLAIEYEGYSGEPLTEAQYEAALQLHRRLLDRWEIPADADHILGHDRFDSVERKLNPGPAFPWTRLLDDLKLSESSFKSETIVAGQAPEPEPLTLLTPTEAELEPLEMASEASFSDRSESSEAEIDEETLPITLDGIFQASTPKIEPIEQLELPQVEPVAERNFPEIETAEQISFPELEPIEQESLLEPASFEQAELPEIAPFEQGDSLEAEVDEHTSLYEAEVAEQANMDDVEALEPTSSPEAELVEPTSFSDTPPRELSDLIFDDDLPFELRDQVEEAPSEVEQQLQAEIDLAHEAAEGPAPLSPMDETRLEEEAGEVETPSAPELAAAWTMPETVEEESYIRPQLKEEVPLPLPLIPEESPDISAAPSAVNLEEASEPTIIAVPPRDLLEELDDSIFDEELPPGIKEDELPTLSEATSAKLDLPDFNDFDSLFDEISGLGDPVSKVEIKPFEIEGAPRSSAPIAPPPAAKREAAPAPLPPPPDDLTGFIEAPIGGGVVSVELANIRKRPSYDPATVMRTAAKDTRYKFDGYLEGPELQGSTRWLHISQTEGSGWIHSVLVQLDQPFNPAEHEK